MTVRTKCVHRVYDGHFVNNDVWCPGGTEYDLDVDHVIVEQASRNIDNEITGEYLHNLAEMFKLMNAVHGHVA